MISPQKNTLSLRSIVRDIWLNETLNILYYVLGQFRKVSVFIWNPTNEADIDVKNESVNQREVFLYRTFFWSIISVWLEGIDIECKYSPASLSMRWWLSREIDLDLYQSW